MNECVLTIFDKGRVTAFLLRNSKLFKTVFLSIYFLNILCDFLVQVEKVVTNAAVWDTLNVLKNINPKKHPWRSVNFSKVAG